MPLLKITLINLVLSGDNAVVIAMASKNLSDSHRKKAIWFGTAAAVFLRIILTAAAVLLLKIPYLQALGAFLLLYIAMKMLMDESEPKQIRASTALLPAIWTIVVADFIMSLDNVLAIAAVSEGNLSLLLIGIGMSIPIIIWGSQLLIHLLHRYAFVLYVGAAVLAYTAGDMLVSDPKIIAMLQTSHPSYAWFVPVLFIVVTMAAGLYYKRLMEK